MKNYTIYLLRIDELNNIKIGITSWDVKIRLTVITAYAKISKCTYNKGTHRVLATVKFTGSQKQARLIECNTQVKMLHHKSLIDITESNDYIHISKKVTDTTLIKWFTETVNEWAKSSEITLVG